MSNDERRAAAWEGYRVACLDVQGAEYDETEAIAWELLQHELAQLEEEPPQALAA